MDRTIKSIAKKLLAVLTALVVIAVLAIVVNAARGNIDATNPARAEEANLQATLILPDGKIIEGRCSYFLRVSGNWTIVVVDGTRYRMNDWRVVLTSKEE